MAEQQEFVTFTGPLSKIFSTNKVVRFVIQERNFVAFNDHVTLLKDYITKDREGTEAKIMLPIPVSKTKDKQTNIEQIVLTNHTRIFLDDNLIFYPAEQVEDLAIMESAIASAEELAQEYEQEQQTKPKDKEVIVMDKQKRALANQQATPKQLSRTSDIIDNRVIKKGGFYHVEGGKEVPDAVTIEKEVNKLVESSGRVFNHLLLVQDKNDEKAWAKVQVIDMSTGQSKEAGVVHHYNTCADKFLLDLIKNFENKTKDKRGILICPENPILSIENHKFELTPFAKRSIAIRLLTFKQFAERDAATKATSIAYLRMLNRDWRDADEIQAELDEVELVNSNN